MTLLSNPPSANVLLVSATSRLSAPCELRLRSIGFSPAARIFQSHIELTWRSNNHDTWSVSAGYDKFSRCAKRKLLFNDFKERRDLAQRSSFVMDREMTITFVGLCCFAWPLQENTVLTYNIYVGFASTLISDSFTTSERRIINLS